MGVCCQNVEEKENKNEEEKKKKKDKKNKGKEDEAQSKNKMSEEETKVYLESLFKSYYSAKSYFNNNELKEKELDAINC
jgi:hypothetical protein